jgi:hypothetical protein
MFQQTESIKKFQFHVRKFIYLQISSTKFFYNFSKNYLKIKFHKKFDTIKQIYCFSLFPIKEILKVNFKLLLQQLNHAS